MDSQLFKQASNLARKKYEKSEKMLIKTKDIRSLSLHSLFYFFWIFDHMNYGLILIYVSYNHVEPKPNNSRRFRIHL